MSSSHEFLMMICNTTGNAYSDYPSFGTGHPPSIRGGLALLAARLPAVQLDGESAMASMLVIGKRGKASIETCALRRLWQSCNRNRMQCPTQPNPFCPSPGSRRRSGSTAFRTRRSSRRPTSSSAGTLPRSPSASSPSLGS